MRTYESIMQEISKLERQYSSTIQEGHISSYEYSNKERREISKEIDKLYRELDLLEKVGL